MDDGGAGVTEELVGLVPMAGLGTRIQPLAFSKELFPIGFAIDSQGVPRPKPVCRYLFEQMSRAGIRRAVVVVRAGKWDIPGHLLDGADIGVPVAFVVTPGTTGVSESIDKAFPFIAAARIAFGLADILLQPDDIFVRLSRRQVATGADLVLAAMPATDPTKVGMVDFDTAGRVREVVEKPAVTDLRYMWPAAVWTPAFSRLLHDRQVEIAMRAAVLGREVSICEAVQEAIDSGLVVEAEVIEEGRYRDIGTPEELARAIREYANRRAEE